MRFSPTFSYVDINYQPHLGLLEPVLELVLKWLLTQVFHPDRPRLPGLESVLNSTSLCAIGPMIVADVSPSWKTEIEGTRLETF